MRLALQSEVRPEEINEDDLDFENQNEVDQYPWYLINEKKTLPEIWTLIMNLFTIYTLFFTPFM